MEIPEELVVAGRTGVVSRHDMTPRFFPSEPHVDTEVIMSMQLLAGAISARRSLDRRSHRPGLEALESRELLSRIASPGFIPPLSPTAHLPVSGDQLYHESQRKHPLNEEIVGGHVRKVPMFYGPFVGVRSPNLDAIGANGRLIRGQGFVFTGEVLGPISTTRPAIYSFGIDRGGAKAPGNLPNRPMIYYDALVTIATGTSSPTGMVQLFKPSGAPAPARSVPSGDIQVSGDKVQVELPAGMLPPTSPAGTHLPYNRYFYAFWAGTSATSPSGIASFAPEYAITPVASEGFGQRGR